VFFLLILAKESRICDLFLLNAINPPNGSLSGRRCPQGKH